MNWRSSVINSIRSIAAVNGLHDKTDVFYASVDSVNMDNLTCDCTLISGSSDVPLVGVNLMAQCNDGLLRVPTVGSAVYILSAPNITPYVDVFSQIDQIFYVAGGSTLQVDNTGVALMGTSSAVPYIQLQGKSYGGLVQVEALVSKINAIETIINNLKSAVTAVTIAGSTADGGAVKSGILAGLGSGISPTTQRSDLENTQVQHGNGS